MPRLPVPQTISFEFQVEYGETPTIPVVFSHQNGPTLRVVCLVDSGASGVMLPSELAEELGLTLETRSGPVVGATGVGQGWVHALTAKFPDLDDLSFSVEALFLPELPIALIGRDPFFQRMVVAFHHGQGSLYFNAA